jgi:hypothetical protein
MKIFVVKSIAIFASVFGMASVQATTFTVHNKTPNVIRIHKSRTDYESHGDDWAINPNEQRYIDNGGGYDTPNFVWDEQMLGGTATWAVIGAGFGAWEIFIDISISTNGAYEIHGGSTGPGTAPKSGIAYRIR